MATQDPFVRAFVAAYGVTFQQVASKLKTYGLPKSISDIEPKSLFRYLITGKSDVLSQARGQLVRMLCPTVCRVWNAA